MIIILYISRLTPTFGIAEIMGSKFEVPLFEIFPSEPLSPLGSFDHKPKRIDETLLRYQSIHKYLPFYLSIAA